MKTSVLIQKETRDRIIDGDVYTKTKLAVFDPKVKMQIVEHDDNNTK